MKRMMLLCISCMALLVHAQNRTSEYYISTEKMLEIKKISVDEVDKHPYVLRKDPSNNLQQRSVLYQDGMPHRLIITRYDDSDRIEHINISDMDRKFIESYEYFYDAENNPRSTKRTQEDGLVELIMFTANQKTGRQSVMHGQYGGDYEREFYDRQGNRLFNEFWEGGNLTHQEKFFYNEGILWAAVMENFRAGTRTERSYADGQITVEHAYRDTQLLWEKQFTYDEKGRMLTEQNITEHGVLATAYSYAEDGSIFQKIETQDGTPIRIVEYQPDDHRVELLYRRGILILRREYDGEIAVKEYQYEKGQLWNERILQSE